MASLDPRDPRSQSEQLNPTFIIAGVVFVGTLLFGALFAVFLHTALSSSTAPLHQPDRLEYALNLFRAGDNETAARIFSDLARHKNEMAQYWLGHMIELGLGAPRDPQKAIALYKQAAGRDVTAAELSLGEIYLRGDTVPPDYRQAKTYLERAAYHGNARAAKGLGEIYRFGLGLPADPVESYAWSEVASLEGNMSAKGDRDASLHELNESSQQEAVARAGNIIDRIKREAASPRRSSSNRGEENAN
jgi:TPR repeat protein